MIRCTSVVNPLVIGVVDGHNGPGRYLSIFGERHFLNRPNGQEKDNSPSCTGDGARPSFRSYQVGYEHAGEQRVRLKEGIGQQSPLLQGAKKGRASLQNGKGDTEEIMNSRSWLVRSVPLCSVTRSERTADLLGRLGFRKRQPDRRDFRFPIPEVPLDAQSNRNLIPLIESLVGEETVQLGVRHKGFHQSAHKKCSQGYLRVSLPRVNQGGTSTINVPWNVEVSVFWGNEREHSPIGRYIGDKHSIGATGKEVEA